MVMIIPLFQGCSPILALRTQSTQTPLPVTAPPPIPEVTTPTSEIRSIAGAGLPSIIPGNPSGLPHVIHDQSCRLTAHQKKAFGGDEYSLGRMERPFDQNMAYLPGLDIIRVEMWRPGDGWVYFKIILEDVPIAPPAVYGIELDLDIDGRGDFLVQVAAPVSEDWVESGNKIWWDSDGDVGGKIITRSDIPKYRGSGFETLKSDADTGRDPGMVWSRKSVDSKPELDLAVNEQLIGGAKGKFSWKAYTDGVAFPPSQYDLNDYYPLEEAGSPVLGELFYPLKAVHSGDSTCRRLSGLSPSGSEQGVCPP